MDSWQQILAAYPFLQTLWDGLCVVAPLATLIAYSGLFFLSATAKIIAAAKKRSAYGKCARQLALLGLILGWTMLVASRVWLYYTQAERDPGSMQVFLLEMSWLLLSMGVLLSSIFYSLWNALKNMPVLHATIGMIAAVQNSVALMVILFTLRISAGALKPPAARLALPDIFPASLEDPLLSVLCYTLPLIPAMAGAIGACWLVMRRKKDDFGRDYYNNMVRWCAGWAKNAWLCLFLLLLVSTGLAIWRQMQGGVFNAQDAMLDNAQILLWLAPPVCWLIVRKSQLPLRHAWLLFAALIVSGLFMLPYYLQLASV